MRRLAHRQPFTISGLPPLTPDDLRYVMMSVSLIIYALISLGRFIDAAGAVVVWVAEAAGPVGETWEAGLEFWWGVGVGLVERVMR